MFRFQVRMTTNIQPLVSVVIPVFNEQSTLRALVQRVVDSPLNKEIILIDDGSTDQSASIAEALIIEHNLIPIQLFVQPRNLGKGAAVKRGFEASKGDIVLIQDADLEYNPNEYSKLIAPILNDQCDVVYGSRFLSGDIPQSWHTLGNRWLTRFSNLFTGLRLTDMETCFKVFRSHVVKEITPRLRQQRFGIEPELTAKIARRKIRITEVPVSYQARSYAEGKKVGWIDGLKAIWCIIRYAWCD